MYQRIPPEQGGGYMGYVEEVPGALTQGETIDETRENLKEALQLVLETNRERFGRSPETDVVREPISVRS